MKRLTIICFLLAAGTITAFSQKNTVVGKWKPVSFTTQGISVNLDNPAETKKLIAGQISTATGKEADSAQVEMMYNMVAGMISKMSFEFTSKGQAISSIPDMAGMGIPTTDTASYVVDYEKGIITATSKQEDGTEKKEVSKFHFDGEFLVVDYDGKGEIFKLKREKLNNEAGQ
jgi:hypothetical protein